jgi:hypothetical protein
MVNEEYLRYRETHIRAARRWQENHKDKVKRDSKNWAIIHKERRAELSRDWHLKMKLKVFPHYCLEDIKCARCGETDIRCLTLDHIDGSGAKHRKKIGGNIYSWLVKNNYPSGYQVFCMNCQWRKRAENKEYRKFGNQKE